MKVVVPIKKPRAKWLNDLLLSKRAARHADPRNPSRSEQKNEFRKELRDVLA